MKFGPCSAAVLTMVLSFLNPGSVARAADASQGTEPNGHVAIEARSTQTTRVDLRRLGHENGISLVGTDELRNVWLPLPGRLDIEDARLILPWRASFPRYNVASLLLSLDDEPLGSWRLENEATAGVLELPIPRRFLDRRALRLGIELRGWIGDDRCVDQRSGRGFFTLLSDGFLEINHRPPRSIADAIDILPEHTVIALPAPATLEEFQDALSFGIMLERAGHKVTFRTRDVADAHVVIASRLSRLPTLHRENEPPPILAPGSMMLHDGRIVVIANGDAAMTLESIWRNVLASRIVFAPEVRPVTPGTTLRSLGLNDIDMQVVDESTTTQLIRLSDLPQGRWPNAIELLLVGSRWITDARPPVVELRVNGALVGAASLRNEPGPQWHTLPIPGDRIGLVNELRIVVRRQHDEIACRSRPQPLSISWRAESRLRFTNVPETGADIATLAATTRRPALRPTPDALENPAPALLAATFVMREMWRPVWSTNGEHDAEVVIGRSLPDLPREFDVLGRDGRIRLGESRNAAFAMAANADFAAAQVLGPNRLEIQPAREAFRPRQGFLHREAGVAFDANGVVARRLAEEPEPETLDGYWTTISTADDWIVRAAFAAAGLFFGMAAMLTWLRRRRRMNGS